MNTTEHIKGIISYPITPFGHDGNIDTATLQTLINSMIISGVNALAPLGSTGEAAYLDRNEWDTVAAESIAVTDGRVPTIVGASALTTDETVRRAKTAEALGAAAVMILPTSYWALTESETRQHFRTVADAISIPVMAYNNPATTGIDLSPEFLFELVSTIENITMVKESTGDINRMHRLRELSGGELPFFNGSNPLAFSAFEAGATGWCTAAPCLAPNSIVAFYAAIADGRRSDAQAMLPYMQPLLEAIVSRSLPATVKSGLRSIGIDAGLPRRPLLPLSDHEAEDLHRLIVDCETNAL